MKKTFVLDTSVLIHNPDALDSFADNDIRIPVEVIQEIDRLKTEASDRGRQARAIQRKLLKAFGDNDITKSVDLPNGGSLAILLPPPESNSKADVKWKQGIRRTLGGMDVTDHHIILSAAYLAKDNKEKVVLISKDMGMILKGRATGLTVQDYQHDRADGAQASLKNVICDAHAIQRLNATGDVKLEPTFAEGLVLNEYVLLGEKGMPARYIGNGEFIKLTGSSGVNIQNGAFIKPLNIEQVILLDALLSPDISLVTVSGQAGTGKTLLALAAGLALFQEHQFEGISITRPIMSIGQDLGALPGTLEEKMRPWLQPYSDALNVIFPRRRPPQDKPQSQRKPRRADRQQKHPSQQGTAPQIKPYDKLIADGILQIEAIAYIRGRSIPNNFVVLDEVQNTTPKQIKTVVTRMGRNSKLIIMGDTDQIDNPYVDRYSNGLAYVQSRLKNQPRIAHIHLTKGERSEISEIAANLL